MALTGPTSLGRERELVDAEPDQCHGLERPAGHLAADGQPHARRAAALRPCRGRSSGPAARARRSDRPAPGCRGRRRTGTGTGRCCRSRGNRPAAGAPSAASRATAPRPSRRPRSASAARSPRALRRASSSICSRRRAASSSATSATIGNMTWSCRPDGGEQQRAQLPAQHGRPVQHHAQRAPAHGRIVLGRHAPVGQVLVAADIERAEGHRPAAGRVEHLAVVRRLGVGRRGTGCGS